MWQAKRWNELTPDEIFEIMYLRTATFVVEQKRIYQEIDDVDRKAIHVFNEKDGKVVAYARVFLSKDHQHVIFGRVVTAKSVRGTGMGKTLMEHIMQAIREYFPKLPIQIEAQVQVQGYYEHFGFEASGEPFIFESTPHIKMFHHPVI